MNQQEAQDDAELEAKVFERTFVDSAFAARLARAAQKMKYSFRPVENTAMSKE